MLKWVIRGEAGWGADPTESALANPNYPRLLLSNVNLSQGSPADRLCPSLRRVISAIMREVDVAVFSSVAGVGGELAQLSGGVVCSGCCALMIGFSAIVMDKR